MNVPQQYVRSIYKLHMEVWLQYSILSCTIIYFFQLGFLYIVSSLNMNSWGDSSIGHRSLLQCWNTWKMWNPLYPPPVENPSTGRSQAAAAFPVRPTWTIWFPFIVLCKTGSIQREWEKKKWQGSMTFSQSPHTTTLPRGRWPANNERALQLTLCSVVSKAMALANEQDLFLPFFFLDVVYFMFPVTMSHFVFGKE